MGGINSWGELVGQGWGHNFGSQFYADTVPAVRNFLRHARRKECFAGFFLKIATSLSSKLDP
eukprot:4755962-Amphidinium_carterae.1